MKKIYLLVAGLSLATLSFSQEQTSKFTQLVYSGTTDNSLLELEKLIKGDEKMYDIAMMKLELLEMKGKVILSSEEYSPIKERIEMATEKPMDDKEIELMHYANKAKNRYVVVTELVK